MPRERSPHRDQAFEIWRDSGGKISNRELANQLAIPEKTVGAWKAKDGWVSKLNGVLQTTERSTPKRAGAPRGNKNAVGNIGGPGGPVGNEKAVTHGFFRRIFPDDDETHAIIEAVEGMQPVDILWQNIVIQYTAIARAQKLMFVRDQEDVKRHLVRQKGETIKDEDGNVKAEVIQEQQWEFQYPWDRHASFLNAQARAQSELRSLIKDFLAAADEQDVRRLKIDAMKKDIELKNLEIERLRSPGGDEQEDDGFMEALKGEASGVWNDDSDSDTVAPEEG